MGKERCEVHDTLLAEVAFMSCPGIDSLAELLRKGEGTPAWDGD